MRHPRPKHSILSLLLLVALLAASPAGAAALQAAGAGTDQDPTNANAATDAMLHSAPLPACQPPAPFAEGRTVFRIDAASLATTGKKAYDLGDQITVLLENQNPLIYDYRLEAREVVIVETGLTTALKMLLPFTSTFGQAEPEEGESLPKTAVSGRAPTLSDACLNLAESTDARTRRKELLDLLEAAIEAGTTAQTQHSSFVASTGSLRSQMLTPGVRCEPLKTAIAQFRHTVATFPEQAALETFDQKRQALDQTVRAQQSAVDTYQATAEMIGFDCAYALRELLAPWRSTLEESSGRVAALSKLSDQIAADLATARANFAAINQAVRRPNAFYTLVELGPYDLPTDAHLTLSTRAAGDEKATYAQVGEWKLNFGGTARFALGGGAAYSSLGTRTFQRVHGFARNRDGAILVEDGDEVSGQIVGIDEESDQRVGPLLMLHTRLGRPFTGSGEGWLLSRVKPSALHFSFGLSAGILDEDLTANLLVGPSVSFAEERLFLTVGAYYGKNQTLGGNLFVGGLVPEEVTEIPVVREGHWKLGAAVTYRVEVGKKD